MGSSTGWTQTRQIEANPHLIPWVTGRFYGLPFGRSTGTATVALTSLFALPIYVPNISGITITALGLEITAGGTSSSQRLALYNSDSNGNPFALVLDGGTVATTGTGFLSVSVSKFLRQGWYWLANGHAGSGAPTVRRVTSPVATLGADVPTDLGLMQGLLAVGTAAGVTDIVNNGFPGHFPMFNAGPTANMNRLMVGI